LAPPGSLKAKPITAMGSILCFGWLIREEYSTVNGLQESHDLIYSS
jgi:hypothetical protein